MADVYYQFYQEEAILRNILETGKTDRQLQNKNIESIRAHVLRLFEAAHHLVSEEKQEKLEDYLFIVTWMTTLIVRMTTDLEKEGTGKAQKTLETTKEFGSTKILKAFFE